MGSMATSDVTVSTIDNDNIIPKHEPFEDALTPDSESLSPEPESATVFNDNSTSQDPAPVIKRKGGRKPVGMHQPRLEQS